jgi:hypothetical protein
VAKAKQGDRSQLRRRELRDENLAMQVRNDLSYIRGAYDGPDKPEITITVVSDRNATAAAARTRMPWTDGSLITLQVTGSSKREKFDQHDQNVGTAFALARALRATAAGLEQAAWKRVGELGRQRTAAEIRAVSRRTRRQNANTHRYKRATTSKQIRDAYGDEAAARHEARAAERGNQA